MDQADFEALMANAPQAPAAASQEPAPGGSLVDNVPDELRAGLEAITQNTQDDPLPKVGEAFATGVGKSAFETKDFLFGDTPKDERSGFRAAIEDRDAELDKSSMVAGFSSGVGQFAGAMFGIGKFTKVAKALPWFGKGLGAVLEAVPKTAEVGKAALAGAIAFDPHEERLANLIQVTPLANPYTAWLAADPSDSAAEGRMKAALESIGLDATIGGVFMASTKIWKALRQGNAEEASRLADEMQATQKQASEEVVDEQGPIPDGVSRGGPDLSSGSADTGPDTVPPVTDVAGREVPLSGGPEAPPKVVANATDAADAAGTTLNSPQPRIRLSDENTEEVLKGLEADAEAITNAGGWYEAIEAGHTFGRGDGIPYAKLNADRDVDDFMARVVDVAEERLDNLKGGAVLSDEKVDKVVGQMTSLFNADPAQVLGMIQRAGKDANTMVAQMEAGYLVANRLFQDTYTLATRIRLGDFTEFGGRDAALAELKKRASLAVSVYGSARSMTAAGGRAVRRMRQQFRIDPEAVSAMNSMDAEQLVTLLEATDGNPRNVAKVLNPGLLSKVVDAGQFLLINNLVSGPRTQLVNFLTNTYMVGARPLERMLGAAFGAAKGNMANQRIFKESLKQYTYLGTSFVEGFRFARQAFMQNDSVLAPHHTEAYRGNQGMAQMAPQRFKPWSSPGNLLSNALTVATTAIGMPTRTLGFVDEAVKQTVYRSKLMARAHMDGVEQGIEAGLEGDALGAFVKTFIRDKLDAGFDDLGRAVDPQALREAQTATFQQELLPNTIGKWVQTGVQAHPALRLVLPFVKTPTNVIRYGWKMTPGLNLLQTEYREMLKGAMGAEAKAQATGQMMMGGLFMGSAAYMVSQGTITGGGPKDYKAAQELRATGWQPYSVVRQNADGSKTYIPYGRFDPVAIPFGIIADIQDAIHNLGVEDNPEVGAAIGAVLFAVSRQFTDKTYLTGVSQAMDAMMDDRGNKTEKWAQSQVANFIPFSAAMRQLNPDPYLRDARDLTDKLMATVPGLSESVPARYDAYGDPVRKVGLWSSDEDQLVDRETQRLILESGSGITAPQPKHGQDVDLREITLSRDEWAGKNAYEVYQQLAGHPSPKARSLKDTVAKLMQSRGYQLAPDGDIGTKGTKLWRLHAPVAAYRERALKMLKRDPVVRDAFRAADLKVRAQYNENKKANPVATPMKKLGDSFGVDLGNL